ncbi:MAG: sensor histidine kinase N-terminal domain-containing protein, partial [Planctomycetaceae bacterium]|nr:sensor histidine kinase N-terminal domain-containing protein [Planctomycetaceae bacterium]
MTLVNRVSLFFLAALAACLGIDSALSFVLIRDHLYRQFDQQLASSLNALVAAVEVEVDAVKWQPLEHTIAFGDDRAEDDVRWIITDEHGDIRDRSDNLNNNSQQDAALLALARTDSAEQQSIAEAQRWRLLQKRLTAPQPKSDSELEADESAQMTLTVARSTDPLHANLWKLG